ncbi:hypothetical protein KFL_000190170 [Klebsormidium nitens]|uniref:No apical meristem-associated C-terminal domain-containing protein n=1 Tax=Klebsormidium nitens TaxID=105231 RepID=A0A1Y1HSK0_KLENI|nr:hypothetical protein KFL_000190170 [Klebsormidium nitens]|eukprot:GAQ78798.1 hypothetical protein KFL_000190170 [Klebsormidium nitens]
MGLAFVPSLTLATPTAKGQLISESLSKQTWRYMENVMRAMRRSLKEDSQTLSWQLLPGMQILLIQSLLKPPLNLSSLLHLSSLPPLAEAKDPRRRGPLILGGSMTRQPGGLSMRSGLACLNKWDSLLSEVKKVKSYETRRPSGKPGYFQMNQTEKREVALPANVDQQVYNLVLDATAGKASMTPPTVLESSSEGERGEKREDDEDPAPKDEAWMFGAARPEGSPFGEENERGLKRKGKWGEQRKELANTLKSNGEALEVQMQASEEGRQKRHEATLEISKEQWQMDMALRKEQLEIDKKKIELDTKQVDALSLIAQAFAKIAEK